MYRTAREPAPQLSGFFDSIVNAIKGITSGIRITAPPINLPQLPSTYQIPGTYAPPTPQAYMQQPQGQTPSWVMPVALGALGLVAVTMFTQSQQRRR